jgi:hypothetical protein
VASRHHQHAHCIWLAQDPTSVYVVRFPATSWPGRCDPYSGTRDHSTHRCDSMPTMATLSCRAAPFRATRKCLQRPAGACLLQSQVRLSTSITGDGPAPFPKWDQYTTKRIPNIEDLTALLARRGIHGCNFYIPLCMRAVSNSQVRSLGSPIGLLAVNTKAMANQHA